MVQINSIHVFKELNVSLEFLVGLHFSVPDLSTQQRYENLFYKRCHSSSPFCPLLKLGHRIDKSLSFTLLLFSSLPFLFHKHTSIQHSINCALEDIKVVSPGGKHFVVQMILSVIFAEQFYLNCICLMHDIALFILPKVEHWKEEKAIKNVTSVEKTMSKKVPLL